MQRTAAGGRGSIFSESQSSVRALVRNEKVYNIVGTKFWFYFRLVFPYMSIILSILLFSIPYLANADVSGFLFSGCILSLCFGGSVLCSYVHIVPWRRHPSPLIFYRSCSHCLFSLVLMINAYASYNHTSNECKLLSFLVQFSFFTGECWLMTISVDLILSLTNPFASYKSNLRRYHVVVWTSGIIISGVLLDSNSCLNIFSDGVCWIDASLECIVGFYLFWVVLFFLLSMCVMIFSAWRLSRGLQSTYATRKACVKDTFNIVACYLIYGMLVFFLFIILTPQHNLGHNSRMSSTGKNVVAYILALRGFVDALLWFTMHDFAGYYGNKTKPASASSYPIKQCSSPLLDSVDTNSRVGRSSPECEFTSEANFEGEFGIDVDLSPQLNLALRQEVVHFTTMGIIKSVELNLDSSTPTRSHTGAIRVFPLEDDSHIFSDYEPDTFRRLRTLIHVDERRYQVHSMRICIGL